MVPVMVTPPPVRLHDLLLRRGELTGCTGDRRSCGAECGQGGKPADCRGGKQDFANG
jgi:hypothetical protein